MQTLRGVWVLSLLTINTCLLSIPGLIFAAAKFAIPYRPWVRFVDRGLTWVGSSWLTVNHVIFRRFLPTKWSFSLPPGLNMDDSYLVISNHIAAVDAFAVTMAFNRRIPLIKYFIKRPILLFPLVGVMCWACDMPFVRRYSAEQIARNPKNRERDRQTTRRAAEKYRGRPSTIANFIEGTRQTPKNYAAQDTPYTNLLNPKGGGVSLVTEILGDQLDTILDTTLHYPNYVYNLWDFFCGRLSHVDVVVEAVEPPREHYGDYEAIKGWLHERWAKKDALIDSLEETKAARHAATADIEERMTVRIRESGETIG